MAILPVGTRVKYTGQASVITTRTGVIFNAAVDEGAHTSVGIRLDAPTSEGSMTVYVWQMNVVPILETYPESEVG